MACYRLLLLIVPLGVIIKLVVRLCRRLRCTTNRDLDATVTRVVEVVVVLIHRSILRCEAMNWAPRLRIGLYHVDDIEVFRRALLSSTPHLNLSHVVGF